MPTPEQEAQDARKKRTYLLMAGGAASLILPLCGVVYLRMKEAKEARGPNSAVMFERREAGETKVSVSQAVAIVSPASGLAAAPSAAPVGSAMPMGSPLPAEGAGGSLGMIKGNGDFLNDKKAEAPAVSTQTAPAKPPVVEEGGPIVSKGAPKKGAKKAFVMPKLQSGKGFTSFKGSPKPSGGGDIGGVMDPQAAGKGGMGDMLKNMPAGAADNPELQKLLQQQGK